MIVVTHWAEHVAQAIQIWMLGELLREEAGGRVRRGRQYTRRDELCRQIRRVACLTERRRRLFRHPA